VLVLPAHGPAVQLLKRDPAAAAAVKVTFVPNANCVLQVAPQLMPAGLLVTVPLPVPIFDTVSVCGVAEVVVKLCVGLLNVPAVVT
jgi:hypothetical protein